MRFALAAALALWCLTWMAGFAFAESAEPPPPESYSGPRVAFLEHIHGVWRGVQNCPNSKVVTVIDLSLIQLDKPNEIGGVFHLKHGFQVGNGPMRVRVDEAARTLHIELLNPNGSLNGSLQAQLSASGERFVQVNSTSQCTPLVLVRQVDPRAAGPTGGPPVITQISELKATQHQRIIISGHGFGTHAPIHGNSVVFAINNHSAVPKEWDAGFAGDAPPDVLTIGIRSWTDTEILSNGFFTGYGSDYHLSPSDKLTFYVWNPGTLAGPAKFDVVVSASPSEPMALPRNTFRDLTQPPSAECDRIAKNADLPDVIQCYRAKARDGDASAMFVLGRIYDMGSGVTKNHDESVKWMQKASHAGYAPATNYLVCYNPNVTTAMIKILSDVRKDSESIKLEAAGVIFLQAIADPDNLRIFDVRVDNGVVTNFTCSAMFALNRNITSLNRHSLDLTDSFVKELASVAPIVQDFIIKKTNPDEYTVSISWLGSKLLARWKINTIYSVTTKL